MDRAQQSVLLLSYSMVVSCHPIDHHMQCGGIIMRSPTIQLSKSGVISGLSS